MVYIVTFLSGAFGAVYFTLNQHSQKLMPMSVLLFSISLLGFIISSAIASAITGGRSKLFSFDPVNGSMGFFDADNVWIVLVLQGVFGSFMGSAGYMLSLYFYSPVVTSSAFLLEPLVAQALGTYLGIDKFPGILTLIGMSIVIFGIVKI
jgi:drug/metabolite transporter (DMT)-like permease